MSKRPQRREREPETKGITQEQIDQLPLDRRLIWEQVLDKWVKLAAEMAEEEERAEEPEGGPET